MVKYVYCGLYDIDLRGETSAEFDGEHPNSYDSCCFSIPQH